MFSMAKDVGFQGVELHGSREIAAEEIRQALEQLRTGPLEVTCISPNTQPCRSAAEVLRTVTQAIETAASLKAPFVRILSGRAAWLREVDAGTADAALLEGIRPLLPLAKEHRVTLLIESNGVFAETKRLCALLDALSCDHIGALWDVHHTFRYAGESPEQTVQNLGAHIKYVHCKDSVLENGAVSYRLMGEGDLPIKDFFHALRSIKYDSWLTFEWLRRYTPELEDAGVAFPQFVSYISQFLSLRSAVTTRIYDNKDGTGKYLWPRGSLLRVTYSELLDHAAESLPEQYYVRDAEAGYFRTYREFRQDVDAAARGLIAIGVRPGDHVAMWAPNLPQWLIAFWAAVKIGAVLVSVNTAYKIHEMEYLLRQSDTHTLIMAQGFKDADYAGDIRSLCPELETTPPGEELHAKRFPFLRNVVTVGFTMPGCYAWDEMVSRGGDIPQDILRRRAAAVSCDDVCSIQYTSGTTGFPKGVMQTHFSMIESAKIGADQLDYSSADRILCQVPLFHIFGIGGCATAAMINGCTLCPVPYYSPVKVLDCINREKCTLLNGVPSMFMALQMVPSFAQTDFSQVRGGVLGGSLCPAPLAKFIIEKMNMSKMIIAYGLTESCGCAACTLPSDTMEHRTETVGTGLNLVEAKIVDANTGEELPDNTDGEFLHRSGCIMRGYYKMPEATAAAIDAEGWLHTGDIARRDSDGYFRITGRLKDMIIRGGENVYPKELEEFLFTHPKVHDAQVVAVPDPQYGEEIFAWVILNPGESATEQELRDFVRSHLSKQKTPRYIRFIEAFPMNAAGKVLKYKLREQAAELIKKNNL
jgi:fatty-acyl-CoA synthase